MLNRAPRVSGTFAKGAHRAFFRPRIPARAILWEMKADPDSNSSREDGDPPLDREEQKNAESRVSPHAAIVYEAIVIEGRDELKRPSSALAWSGLAAGLSMGFSFVAEGLLAAALPDALWRPLVAKFGYCIGFILVILGRQQLFTENTLTPVLPLLRRKTFPTFLSVLRLWGVVLLANMVGTLLFAFVVAHGPIFDAPTMSALTEVASQGMGESFLAHFLRAIFAGWLIALLVWLLPFAETARVGVIVIITYLVGLGHFDHIIAGSVKTLFLVTSGGLSWGAFFSGFWLPALLGNILGGVLLVAVINHAQVVSGDEEIDG